MATTLISENRDLDQSTFVNRVTTFLKPVTRRYNKLTDRERVRLVLEDVSRYARYNEEDGISVLYCTTVYAIQWAIDSLRLCMQATLALETMNVRQIVALIHEVHTHCPTQGDVPRYLNEKYFTTHPVPVGN